MNKWTLKNQEEFLVETQVDPLHFPQGLGRNELGVHFWRPRAGEAQDWSSGSIPPFLCGSGSGIWKSVFT